MLMEVLTGINQGVCFDWGYLWQAGTGKAIFFGDKNPVAKRAGKTPDFSPQTGGGLQ
jgi:hypothetical protein